MPENVTQMSFEERVDAFRQTADNPVARANYAVSRATVILPLINQQSTVRFIFRPVKLAPGATPVFDIPFDDIDACWMMPQIGAVPTVQVEGSQLMVDTFGLDGGVEYQQDVAREGRIDVGNLATILLKNKFIAQEELAGWGLIKAHAAVVPSTQQVAALDDTGGSDGAGVLNIYTLNETLTTADELGIGGRRVTDIYCSPRRFGDLRTAIYGGPQLPEVVREQLWDQGMNDRGTDAGVNKVKTVADIRIHRVYNHALVDNAHAYAFTQREGYFYGVMPIREELRTMDNMLSQCEWKNGILGRERLGFGAMDDKGLIVISFGSQAA